MKVDFVMLNVIKFIKVITFWAQKNKVQLQVTRYLIQNTELITYSRL